MHIFLIDANTSYLSFEFLVAIKISNACFTLIYCVKVLNLL